MHYYRRIIVDDNISLQYKLKVNALNQKNRIIYSHYTHLNICARHWAIIHHDKVQWFFILSCTLGCVTLFLGASFFLILRQIVDPVS